jgi:trehalose utilization protein
MIRVTIWNEARHEHKNPKVAAVYPDGIHGAIAKAFPSTDFTVQTATLDQAEHGLTLAVLEQTDVLYWWGHLAHGEVSDEIVARVKARVLAGMGLVVLHSGHFSKIFKVLMGTTCDLKWREANDRERIWTVAPGHRIAQGLPECILLEEEEMYGEHFDIPAPEELVFVSWFSGGEVFRSGCTYHRGQGKIFYFRPGHEIYPTYHHSLIQQVLVNAAFWAAPSNGATPVYGNALPLEPMPIK